MYTHLHIYSMCLHVFIPYTHTTLLSKCDKNMELLELKWTITFTSIPNT